MSCTEYKWPTLAEEGTDMIDCATLMYGTAALRELARKGLLTNGDAETNKRILQLPATVDDVINIVEANKETLIAYSSEEDHKIYGNALLSLKPKYPKENDSSQSIPQSQLVAFDDENSANELVYGIEVNHYRKRIIVGFRGSVTVKDFMVDAKAHLCEIPNPLEPDSGKMLGIHHGFYEYLFEQTKGPSKEERPNAQTKCKMIMDQVATLSEEYPDYRLYVTGHSLGMALATLFAAEAAASKDERIKKPVSVIGVASPKVGNEEFRKVFQTLEREGLVRCLRIQNFNDAVTTMPDDANDFRCISCNDRKIYRHVGLQITIDKNGAHEFAYVQEESGSLRRMMKNGIAYFGHSLGVLMMLPVMMFYSREFLNYHSCVEYRSRFIKFSERNKGLFLNDVYRDDVPHCDGEFGVNISTT